MSERERSASSITYHDNEMVNTVTHGNALQDVYGADPHAMKRPASVSANAARSRHPVDDGDLSVRWGW